jgi:low affinity Fe/Cu permease
MAAIQKSMDSSSLAEVIDRILDKGVVIDIWARVSLVGIELLTMEQEQELLRRYKIAKEREQNDFLDE